MKISAIEIQNDSKNIQNTNFKGLKLTPYNEYEFYSAPYDKDKYNILLEVCGVVEDGKGGFKIDEKVGNPITINKSYRDFIDHGYTRYSRKSIISDPGYSEYMGYRFRLVDKNDAKEAYKKINADNKNNPFGEIETKKYILDPGVKVNVDGYGDFTVISNRMGVTPKSGSALHVFYDSYSTKNTENQYGSKIDRSTFVRNHFNKALGDIDGILDYTDEIKPYAYVMSNPYIGVDSRSSHKYWGENFFKVPSEQKFKKVITELFKSGKGYIADGAFTSQSIQSPLFQHVLKYGKNSLFRDWFKIKGRIKLGILPDNVYSTNSAHPNPYQYIGFKLVNPMGYPDYDHNKPSYIQFFDSRLASREQQNDRTKLIETYDNANPQDHYDITTHEDSIVPFFFELDYGNEFVRQKFTGYTSKMLTDTHEMYSKLDENHNRIIDHLDKFFSFENFDIVRKSEAAGADFWDGNTDLVKMNLSNPNPSTKNVDAYYNTRDYLYNVATHWTKFANNALVGYIAKCYSEGDNREIAKIAKANDISSAALEKTILNARVPHPDEDTPSYSIQSVADELIKNFNFPTLDLSDQATPVLFCPELKKRLQSPYGKLAISEFVARTLIKLNEELPHKIIESSLETSDILLTEFEKKLFEESSENEKARAESYKDIQKHLNSIKLTPYGREILDMFSSQIMGFIILKGIFPNEKVNITPDGTLKTSQNIKEASMYGVGAVSTGNIEDDARSVANKIIFNLFNTDSYEDARSILADNLANTDLKYLTPESLKFAREFVKQARGGLNWRFDAAKDVADLTSNRNGIRTAEDSMDDIIEFWGQFVKNVRDINPSSYVVAEITDLWALYDINNYISEASRALGDKASQKEITNMANALRRVDWGKYINPNIAERMLYEKTGATTGSQYSRFFGLAPNLFSQNFEYGNYEDGIIGNMNEIKSNLEAFMDSMPLLGITHSHIFYDNHDKPRGTHCLAIDLGAYLSRFGINSPSKTQQKDIENARKAADNVLGIDKNSPIKTYEKISSKAVVVGDLFKRSFEKVLKDDPQKLRVINKAIENLALGKSRRKDAPDFVRAEAFGELPFEITIGDVMKEARFIALGSNIPWYDAQEAKEVENAAFKEVMAPALKKMLQITQFLNAITGIPFLYAGNNLGQTGYEYATKNITQANRNLIRHEWIDPKSSEFKPEIKRYYDKMQAIASMYKEYGLSAIAGGMPISLPQQDSKKLYALLKYDDKGSNVIQVFSNVGITKDIYEIKEDKPIEVPYISVVDSNGVEYKINSEGGSSYMKRKVYSPKKRSFVDEVDEHNNPVKYIIADGKLRRADGEKIVLNDTVTTFYKPLINNDKKQLEIMNRYHRSI